MCFTAAFQLKFYLGAKDQAEKKWQTLFKIIAVKKNV